MRRERHRLDLLPLLDVFMVVLFVFATIQEQKLDETTHDVEQQRSENEVLAERLAQTADELRAREQQLQGTADDDELAQLRARAEAAERHVAELDAAARRTIEDLASGDDPVRRHSVLSKLLDRHGVFEVEIAGTSDATGAVINRCCFRSDPLSQAWQSCGEIPAVSSARLDWWTSGGGGLATALRRTKGGNAMTIIRQDARASYRIAAGMEQLLRDRLPEHQVYDEGVALVDIHCGEP
jgi:biopolymer transport protein ExbD